MALLLRLSSVDTPGVRQLLLRVQGDTAPHEEVRCFRSGTGNARAVRERMWMATYKLLEDYRDSLGVVSSDELLRAIRTDYARGSIDFDNYDELLSDLKDEEPVTLREPLVAPMTPSKRITEAR
jgi:hypothetical protein